MLTEHIELPNCDARHLVLEQRQPKTDRPGWVIIAYVWPRTQHQLSETTLSLRRVEIASYHARSEAEKVFDELHTRLAVAQALGT